MYENIHLMIKLWKCNHSEITLKSYLGWTDHNYSEWIDERKIPWIEKVYQYIKENQKQSYVNMIFDEIATMKSNSNYSELNNLLLRLNMRRLNPRALTAIILNVTSCQNELEAYSDFLKLAMLKIRSK